MKGGGPKLPVKQLTILAVARFAEPLALTSVFPYLPEMIESFGVDKKSVAKWAGITSAVFSLSQSLTAVAWGRASDYFGRKYVIIIGLASTMFTFLIWGLTTSLPMAITVRAIQGGGNGNVGIIRTMVAEMVPYKELQPTAFSLMPLVWSLGSIFGPSFGGYLANPVAQYPGLFGSSRFFTTFPYSLPNIVAAVFFLISLATAILFLEETLQSRRHSKDWGLIAGRSLTRAFHRLICGRRRRGLPRDDDDDSTPLLTPPSQENGDHVKNKVSSLEPTKKFALGDVFTRQTVVNLLAYTLLAMHSVAADQLIAVFLSYPIQKPSAHNTRLPFYFSGGFGLPTSKIGTIFTVYGIACGLIQFLGFPPICRYLGPLKCFKVCVVVFPLVYFAMPYITLIQDQEVRYFAFFCIMVLKAFAVIFSFPCITILLTNSTESLSILGTVNGFATTFSGLGRAFGPASAGAAFTWGVHHGYMITSWWLLGSMALIGAIPAWFIVEGDGPMPMHVEGGSDTCIERRGDEEDEGERLYGVVLEATPALRDDRERSTSPNLRRMSLTRS